MASNIVPVQNALMSVFYKAGIVDMARNLRQAGVNLYSSGGTAREIRNAGLPVTEVADYTGYPAMFDHRVATLHPKVHGGILFRRDVEQDREDLARYGMVPFDLVVVNLYPVQETIGKQGVTLEQVVKDIDIGGPTLIRGAAKNHKHVAAVVDPADYVTIGTMIRDLGGVDDMTRLQLASKVFRTMSAYDAAITRFLDAYSAQLLREV